MAEHGRRRAEEMKEVAKTARDVDVVPNMSQAIVSAQLGLVDAMLDADIDYSHLEPFDWINLIDTVYGSPIAHESTVREKR